ncbi:hypothetical protein K227x_11450 [Rubripirellula lacrimiformis]|uniref:Uncharacterized protein n=1 Tax=Rubripirellula lacrimiformis TaxID=1930273 RepID=A0A517N6K2_9BACT|nr:hypothetical protein [Rubripirellula lacrimiformis]QDT02767.1 hypothetical protein K227x_11450 [Rubripirellula lacrimiformis]
MANPKRIPNKFKPWITIRKKFGLSHAHVQMARELGMDVKRIRQPAKPDPNMPGRLPLNKYIEKLYFARFDKAQPDEVKTMEDLAAEHLARRAAKKAARDEEE